MRAAHYAASDGMHAAQGALYEANAEVSKLEAEIRYVVESRNRVQAQMLIQFGNEKDLLGQRVNSSAVADLLARGTAKLSRQDIQDRLDKLQAELGFSGGGTTLRIAMSTKRENLPELTRLALDIVRNANFPNKHSRNTSASSKPRSRTP